MASLPDQDATPYLDALREHAARNPARLYVPGHKGGPGAAPALLDAIGERALALDIPALTHGIDTGVEPNPFQQSQDLAAQAQHQGPVPRHQCSEGQLRAGITPAGEPLEEFAVGQARNQAAVEERLDLRDNRTRCRMRHVREFSMRPR